MSTSLTHHIGQYHNKTIVIWTEGGKKIGMGHICRCLVIARKLRKMGTNTLFLVNDDPAAIERIKRDSFGYEIVPLSEAGLIKITSKSPTAILIDSKKQITDLIKQIKQSQSIKPRLILMDNITSARLEADTVIYPTALFENNLNWDGFKGKVFGGADYVPVADTYIMARQKAEHLKFQPPYQALVMMGGGDPNHLTYKVLSSLLKLSEPINVKVVIGPAFLPDTRLDKIEKLPNVDFIKNKEDLSLIMAESHIAITAIGITIYELASVGVPAIIISNFEEDSQDMEALKKLGVHLPLGYYHSVQSDDLKRATMHLLSNHHYWESLRTIGWEMIDGKGAERIAKLLSNGISMPRK